jgi:hypothetical protein
MRNRFDKLALMRRLRYERNLWMRDLVMGSEKASPRPVV